MNLVFIFLYFLGPDAVLVNDETKTDEDPPELCYFLDSPEIKSDLAKTITLGEKCLTVKSPKYVFGYGSRAISVDDLKCGTKNASSVELIENSELCHSKASNKLSKLLGMSK